jgi:putative hydrolase of the HAD superfamily
MFYKNLIFDIDDTLYDYTSCNLKSLEIVFQRIQELSHTHQIDEIRRIYNSISEKHVRQTLGTSASHNKYIKLKHTLEVLCISLQELPYLDELYWKTFYSKIQLYEGVLEFITWNKSIGVKIGVLSNYDTEHQINKLAHLKLLNIIDCIVTSQEVGCEKPSSSVYNYILNKMNAEKSDTIMIGDNYKNDITGALDSEILPYWFNILLSDNEVIIRERFVEFNSFSSLYIHHKQIYHELCVLQKISRHFGERVDLVQGGGGNTSVKMNSLLFIKSSGKNLSEIKVNSGYAIMNNNLIIKEIERKIFDDKNNLCKCKIIGKEPASIETYMHSILKKYVVHLHSIQMNRILVLKEGFKIIKKMFPDSLFVNYYSPGLEICDKILESYNGEEIIFLGNHGIIISVEKYDKLIELTDLILEKFEKHEINSSLNKVNDMIFVISSHINNKYNLNNVTYMSCDVVLKEYVETKQHLFYQDVTFPDSLIFCGYKCCLIKELNNLKEVDTYFSLYNEIPKIIICDNKIYINSISLIKCRDIESVLKARIMIADTPDEKIYLSNEELLKLVNSKSEKYRQSN